jgi:peptidase MA superfamily protein
MVNKRDPSVASLPRDDCVPRPPMLLLALSLLATDSTRVGSVTIIAGARQQQFAVALAREAQKPVDWPALGRRIPPPFTLVLAPDSASLARMTRGQAPGWGAGVTYPESRTIILRADLPDVPQTLRHELAHLVLGSLVQGRLPLWFEEGFAAWGSGEVSRAESLELNLAVAAGRVPTFSALDAMLRSSPSTADLAYALAASAVAEIGRRGPPGGLERLLGRLEAGESFDSALVASTGLTTDRFEESWQTALRRRYSLLTWLVAGGMWTVIAFGLGGLAWYRRERDRPRRAALDQGWIIDDGAAAAGGGSPPAGVPDDHPEGDPVDPRDQPK